MEGKILYIIDTLAIGGAERSTLDIASRLPSMEAVVCHIYKNDTLKNEFLGRGIRVISLNIEKKYGFAEAIRRVIAVLKEEKPSLVVATLLRSELIARIACVIVGIPNVGTFVNDTYSSFELKRQSLSMKLKTFCFWIPNMLTARLCVGFLANSESIKISNCAALLVPKKKVNVIYRGRPKGAFSVQRNRSFGKDLKFLAIGRLLERKGFRELLHAFDSFLRLTKSNASLTIVGEGIDRPYLEALIRKLSRENSINLTGASSNIPDLMYSHDIFVFPSHYEGFSGVLVEAMFSRIPIIASNIPMNLEAVEHDRSARIFKVKDVTSLTEEMIWMKDHPAEALQLGECARSTAEARFDIDLIANQHEEYYKEVLRLK